MWLLLFFILALLVWLLLLCKLFNAIANWWYRHFVGFDPDWHDDARYR